MDHAQLKSIPIFSGLDDTEFQRMAQVASIHRFRKDTVVFFEEEVGESFFLIHKGRVKVSRLSNSGKEIILAILRVHDFFGEMSVLDNAPRSATVIAMEDTELVKIRRSDFMKVMHDHPEIAIKMLATFSERLRKANEKIGNLALLDVYGRVARVLLDMASEQGIRRPDGTLSFRRPTHQEIANTIGTSRETVSRTLSDLQKRGYIDLVGKEIHLKEGLKDAMKAKLAP
ncbi:MAG: Crp/Fnr family transcriptional regulator [Acidobacteriota bacterium]